MSTDHLDRTETGPAAVHLTERELAERWRSSTRTLQRRRRDGSAPPHLLVGGRVLYPVAEIEAFEARALRRGEDA